MPQDPYLGRQILGQYHIEKKLGEGGMGMVYQADQPAMSRKAAIKILRPEMASEDQIQRFQREAQALANIEHPHIIRVYNFGTLDDGALYMAMEFVQGREMDKELEQNGRMEWERAVNVSIQAADALVEAHRHGIVHRDLKPENILLMEWRESTDYVKVLDFGIAKVLDNSQVLESSATVMGVIHGTPMYMSPEQARGDKVDHRSDIYSLGIVLYAMMTGELPIKSNTLVGYIIAHQQDPPSAISQYVQGVPKDLETITSRMLEKQPEDRYQTMQEVLDEFRALVAPPPPKRTGLKVAIGVALALLLAAGGVIGYLATRPEKEGTTFQEGVEKASDPKPPAWLKKPLTTKGDRTLVVTSGTAETKGESRAKALRAAHVRLLAQVARSVRGSGPNEEAFRKLYEATRELKPAQGLLTEALTPSPLKLDEAEASYWERRRASPGAAAEFHYHVQQAVTLQALGAAKKWALKHKTAFGIRVIPVLPVVAAALGVPSGVLVAKLKKGKAAEEAGLQPGDVIVRVDGRGVDKPKPFAAVIKKAARRSKKAGPFPVEYVRLVGGKPVKKTVELSK